MFVSSKMMEIFSNLAWMFLLLIKIVFLDQQTQAAFIIVCLLMIKLLLNVLIGYLSCILVSRVQSSKTMLKILQACNLKLN